MFATASKYFCKRLQTWSANPPVSLGKCPDIRFEILTADLHDDGLGYGKLMILVPHSLGP